MNTTIAVGRSASTSSTSVLIALITLVAAILRIAPTLLPGGATNIREYDDGVMMAAAIALVDGELPYTDFVYLHPPGSLLLLAPAALLSDPLSEAGALALARVFMVLVGAANTALIGFLLRKHGTAAVVVGAGLYAVWPMAVVTERTVLLEPILNLCLLVALWCLASRRRGAAVIAGISLGIALSVKYWAVVDVIIIAAAVAAAWGLAGLWRYLLAGVITVSVITLPFFAQDPAAMWEQSVVTQLGRPAAAGSLADKAHNFSPFLDIHRLDQFLPVTLWLAVVALALLITLLPLFTALRAQHHPRLWPQDAWWGLLALTHAAILVAGASFYYHYAPWLMAPLALALGAVTTRLRRRFTRRAVGLTATVAVLVLAAADLRHVTAPATDLSATMSEWATTRDYIWGSAPQLIAANAVQDNLDTGCPMDIDTFGNALVVFSTGFTDRDDLSTNTQWISHSWEQIGSSDGVMLPMDKSTWWLTDQQREQFESQFVLAASADQLGLWDRKK